MLKAPKTLKAIVDRHNELCYNAESADFYKDSHRTPC